MYTNGDRPLRRGVRDKERFSWSTPAYAFGWVLSSVELFKALYITDEPPPKLRLIHLPDMIEVRIEERWETKNYVNYTYK